MGRGGGGGGRSGGGGAATAAQAQAGPQLPDGVTEQRMAGADRIYSFTTTENNDVRVVFSGNGQGGESRAVMFLVNRTFDRGNLSSDESRSIASKINQITKYDVSNQPNGTSYANTAWTADGNGEGRAIAYTRAGFSPPKGGLAGRPQYGKVENGKLIPDLKKAGMTKAEADAAIRRLREQRRQERANR